MALTTYGGGLSSAIPQFTLAKPALTYTPAPASQPGLTPRTGSFSTGSVLGTSTSQTTGTGGGSSPTPTPNPSPNPEPQPSYDPYAQLRADINSGYDAYFKQLDEMMNTGLPGQAQAQNAQITGQYQQGANTLGSQLTQGQQDLASQTVKAQTQQAKNLRDLTENMRNLFQSGQNYLGSRGAGDSSAANMYAYALAKQGSKQRAGVNEQYTGIANDIADREFKLKNTYDTEMNNLALERDNKINQVSQWLAEQQNALRQAKATGQLQRGQDIANLSRSLLDNAMNALNAINTQAMSRQSALEQWAVANSENINQLKTNMANVAGYQTPMLSYTPQTLGQIMGGGTSAPTIPLYGGYATNERQRSIFG